MHKKANILFFEVYVSASLDVCEKRDTKGLYKRARAGEIKEFTGISSPYEYPLNPDIVIHTDNCSPDEGLQQCIDMLEKAVSITIIF